MIFYFLSIELDCKYNGFLRDGERFFTFFAKTSLKNHEAFHLQSLINGSFVLE